MINVSAGHPETVAGDARRRCACSGATGGRRLPVEDADGTGRRSPTAPPGVTACRMPATRCTPAAPTPVVDKDA